MAHVERDLARERHDHDTTRRNLMSALVEQAAVLDEIARLRATLATTIDELRDEREFGRLTEAQLEACSGELIDTQARLATERESRLAESAVLTAADALFDARDNRVNPRVDLDAAEDAFDNAMRASTGHVPPSETD